MQRLWINAACGPAPTPGGDGCPRPASQRPSSAGPQPESPDSSNSSAIGYVLTLEGADSLVTLDYLERAYGYGLRAIGPAHYGPGRYAPGTGLDGPLKPAGRELLRKMDELRMVLDVTHLTDHGFWEALDLFAGLVWASHSNCRAWSLIHGSSPMNSCEP